MLKRQPHRYTAEELKNYVNENTINRPVKCSQSIENILKPYKNYY